MIGALICLAACLWAGWKSAASENDALSKHYLDICFAFGILMYLNFIAFVVLRIAIEVGA